MEGVVFKLKSALTSGGTFHSPLPLVTISYHVGRNRVARSLPDARLASYPFNSESKPDLRHREMVLTAELVALAQMKRPFPILKGAGTASVALGESPEQSTSQLLLGNTRAE